MSMRWVEIYYIYFQDGRKKKIFQVNWLGDWTGADIHRTVEKETGGEVALTHIVIKSLFPISREKKEAKLTLNIILTPSALFDLSEDIKIKITQKERFLKEAERIWWLSSSPISSIKFRKKALRAMLHNKRWIVWRRQPADFQIKCDESNNPPTDIENHILNVDLFIKPTGPPSIEIIAALRRPPRTWLKQLDRFVSK